MKQKHVYGLEVSYARKQPRLQDFLPKTRTKTSLITNSNHEIRKTRTQHMQNKNPTTFYYKEEIEQSHDKKMYPTMVLNKLKEMGNSTFIYNLWAPSLRKFLKKFPMYIWPIFSHV